MAEDTAPLSEKERAILEEVVRVMSYDGSLPQFGAVLAATGVQPWEVDAAEQRGVVSIHGAPTYILPTRPGLRTLGGALAERLGKTCRELMSALQDEERQSPGQSISVERLGNKRGIPQELVRLAAMILQQEGRFASVAFDDRGVSQLQVRPGGLIDASDRAATPSGKPKVRITASNFRGLRSLSWEPEGVVALVGPNGAGKTTTLRVLRLLRNALEQSFNNALGAELGPLAVRRLEASDQAGVHLALSVGTLRWTLELIPTALGIQNPPGEELSLDGKPILRRASNSPRWYVLDQPMPPMPDGLCLPAARRLGVEEAEPLIQALLNMRLHLEHRPSYMTSSMSTTEARVHENGENLLSVLRNWSADFARRVDSYEWVLAHLRVAFPGVVDEFKFTSIGGQVVAEMVVPGSGGRTLPLSLASDGLFSGLLHLTAVAGAPKGSLLAIDELEDSLHPHALHTIFDAIQERAASHDLTVILATHSPLILDRFRDMPEQVYVMEPGQEVSPTRLTDLKTPDWLAHFSLGDLYGRERFGGPQTDGRVEDEP